jgi:lipoprotein NlpD
MSNRVPIRWRSGALACLAMAVAGCASAPGNDATIVERSQAAGAPPPAAAPPPAPATVREAHEGVYTVQPGDTLYSIALAFGQDFRDIAQWNGLDDPTHIHVGQALRVAPPAAGAAAAAEEAGAGPAEATAVPVAPSGAPESRPLAPAALPVPAPAAAEAASTAASAAKAGGAPGAAPSPSAQPPAQAAGGQPAPAAAPPQSETLAAVPPASEKPPLREPEGVWIWPTQGKLLQGFDEAHNKGIDIAGNVGDPVYAANDGQVVYSGSSLPGYGKLVIIKHTDDFVSAYAHNNEILVTQGQEVKRGQRIADLGMTDAPTPRLHFEIRRRGTPVDPLTYLPPR